MKVLSEGPRFSFAVGAEVDVEFAFYIFGYAKKSLSDCQLSC